MSKLKLVPILCLTALWISPCTKAALGDGEIPFATIIKPDPNDPTGLLTLDYQVSFFNGGINIDDTGIGDNSTNEADYIFDFNYLGPNTVEITSSIADFENDPVQTETQNLNIDPTQVDNGDKLVFGFIKEITLDGPFRVPLAGSKVYLFPNDTAILILPNGTNVHFEKKDGKTSVVNVVPMNVIGKPKADNLDKIFKVKGLKGEQDCTLKIKVDHPIETTEPIMESLDDLLDKFTDKQTHSHDSRYISAAKFTKFNNFSNNAPKTQRYKTKDVIVDGNSVIISNNDNTRMKIVYDKDFEIDVNDPRPLPPREIIYFEAGIDDRVIRTAEFMETKDSKAKSKNGKTTYASKGSFNVPGTNEKLFNFTWKTKVRTEDLKQGNIRITLDPTVPNIDTYAEALGIPADGNPHTIAIGTGSFKKFTDDGKNAVFEHNITTPSSPILQVWSYFDINQDQLIGLGNDLSPSNEFVFLTSRVDTSDTRNISGQTIFKCSATQRSSNINSTIGDPVLLVDTFMQSDGGAGDLTVNEFNNDIIQEVTISTSGIEADPSPGGCVVNVVTKSNGNLFSGTISTKPPED